MELWEPRNDVFPDGFNFDAGLPLALHNRWFSANNNTYIHELGFAGSFIAESDVDFALPIKADVFTYLMAKAKAWGMVLYEQCVAGGGGGARGQCGVRRGRAAFGSAWAWRALAHSHAQE